MTDPEPRPFPDRPSDAPVGGRGEPTAQIEATIDALLLQARLGGGADWVVDPAPEEDIP